jgi:hypothetical protein
MKACAQLGLPQEGGVLCLLGLHWLDVGAQGFVGLAYRELFYCCVCAVCIADADRIAKLSALKDGGTAGRE